MSGCLFVHGCPPDSITTYLYSASDAYLRALFGAMEEKLCFVGHTHDLALVCSDGVQILRLPLPAGHTLLDEGCKYIVNVGSVGQPRDGNNNAKYVIWDSAMKRLEVRFVPYDMAPTAEKILALGFPEFNARRLW
jgi:diadenosine tetraphosphatase ApaH/serine/threonine PP2A family protein phosphatase